MLCALNANYEISGRRLNGIGFDTCGKLRVHKMKASLRPNLITDFDSVRLGFEPHQPLTTNSSGSNTELPPAVRSCTVPSTNRFRYVEATVLGAFFGHTFFAVSAT